jgi:membrane-associated phospholipid phosphatase
MGLIVAAMWRKRVLVFIPELVWLLLMLFSTMPFGGHYFVDLIGGTAVWGGWFAASQRIERRVDAARRSGSLRISGTP